MKRYLQRHKSSRPSRRGPEQPTLRFQPPALLATGRATAWRPLALLRFHLLEELGERQGFLRRNLPHHLLGFPVHDTDHHLLVFVVYLELQVGVVIAQAPVQMVDGFGQLLASGFGLRCRALRLAGVRIGVPLPLRAAGLGRLGDRGLGEVSGCATACWTVTGSGGAGRATGAVVPPEERLPIVLMSAMAIPPG